MERGTWKLEEICLITSLNSGNSSFLGPSDGGDSLKWTPDINGSFSTISTFLNLTKRYHSIAAPLMHHIWKIKIPKM